MKLVILLLALFVVAFATENEQNEDQPQEQTETDDQQNDEQQTDDESEDNEEVSEDDLDIPEDPSYKKHYPCNKKCGTGIYHATGKCNYRTGRCECVYGFTGPNSKYVKRSYPPNKIVADHCRQPCHYTHDYRNKKCAYGHRYYGYGNKKHHHYPTYKKGYPTKKVYNHGYDEYNCHWKCGYGRYHAAGKCVGRNRCLCWWGWTGHGAKYVRKGYYKGRIVASFCTRACHYTHDYTNPKCGYYHGNKHYNVYH